ncbi:hypothetical protein IT418_04040, partial [bacterium]|nr:hypothetical protein [bacterium]
MRIATKDIEWQKYIYKHAIDVAGPRYKPEINIELPITKSFSSIAKDESFYVKMRRYWKEIKKSLKELLPSAENPHLKDELSPLLGNLKTLAKQDKYFRKYSTVTFPWDEIYNLSSQVKSSCFGLRLSISRLQPEDQNTRYQPPLFEKENHAAGTLIDVLHEITRYYETEEAKLTNTPNLLITGSTGIGKTHLLCDLVKRRMDENQFSFIIQGQEITAIEPFWRQVLRHCNTLGYKTITALLNHFNKLGEASKSRFLIIVDAINDSAAPTKWKKSIPDLLTTLSKYPHIGIIFSVRTGFEKLVVAPHTLSTITKIEHSGFASRNWYATKEFFT